MALMGFGEESIGRADVEVRIGKLKNGKAAGGDELTSEMIKGEGDWICRLYNMSFGGKTVCRVLGT